MIGEVQGKQREDIGYMVKGVGFRVNKERRMLYTLGEQEGIIQNVNMERVPEDY